MESRPTNEQNCCPNCGAEQPLREQAVSDMGKVSLNEATSDSQPETIVDRGQRIPTPKGSPLTDVYKSNLPLPGRDLRLAALKKLHPPKNPPIDRSEILKLGR